MMDKEPLTQEKVLQALHDENERLGLYKDAYEKPEQEPDEVTQWKALLEIEYKKRMVLQWQLDKLMEQMLPINDDFIDDVLEDDDFEREKRLAFLQGVRWREAMYHIK